MILDGKIIASKIYEELKIQVSNSPKKPTLWAVLVWDNEVSLRYIKQKRKFAEKIWMGFELFRYPEDISEDELVRELHILNENSEVSGYIVQLPLPSHINSIRVIENISPKKDVDWFHPENQGKVVIWDNTGFIPCTPAGIMKIFEYYNINLLWKNIKILGQSNIVGKPMAQLCINAWATVTSCNSKTKHLSTHTKHADIVICATGQAKLLKVDMIHSSCIVIDVWFSVIDGKIYGDADYENILARWNPITPVPGWVGPMTVAMLLTNTYRAYTMNHE